MSDIYYLFQGILREILFFLEKGKIIIIIIIIIILMSIHCILIMLLYIVSEEYIFFKQHLGVAKVMFQDDIFL